MIPLEDNVGDIIGKAQRGLGITNEALRELAGLTQAQIRAVKSANPPEDVIRKVAPLLRLDADRLVAIAQETWRPQPVPPIPGFAMLHLPFEDMTVNTYLVWDPATRRAVVFDSGPDASAVLTVAQQEKLTVELVLLTHAHTDHVIALPEILKGTGAKAWINVRENTEEDFPEQVETFVTGQKFVIDALRIETRLTSGHSAGQTTFVVRGLARPLAVIGDSMFAGSMGGGVVSYSDQYRNNVEQIFSLPDDTVLAPGHGPLTTVGEEREHNPFFAGLKS